MSKNLIPLLIVAIVIFAGVASIFVLSNPNLKNNQPDINFNQLLTQTPPTRAPTNAIMTTTPGASQEVGNMNNAKTTSDGLQIQDETIGTGKQVKSGDTVTVNYLGTLTNGTKFDSSYDRNQPFTTQIGVGNVIRGWDEGIIGMQVGGKRKLVIPPALGYGDQAAGSIPPNSTLIFEVELIGIK